MKKKDYKGLTHQKKKKNPQQAWIDSQLFFTNLRISHIPTPQKDFESVRKLTFYLIDPKMDYKFSIDW